MRSADLLEAGVKDVALVPATPAPTDGFTAMVERLATSPTVDVAKLEKLIEMQERVIAFQARAAFNAAFARMQPELPEISERGQILVRGQLRSTYAKLEDIKAAITPVLKVYGFAIRHRTEWPADKPNVIRIVGILSHEQGHSEESAFEAPADKSEFRSDIQSQGSTVHYGRRYTTLDLLNITTRGADDDGRRAQAQPAAQAKAAAPDGYDEWLLDLEAVVDNGLPTLQDAWNKSKAEHKRHLISTNRDGWESMKRKAAHVKVQS